jgi:hypothetical protein
LVTLLGMVTLVMLLPKNAFLRGLAAELTG